MPIEPLKTGNGEVPSKCSGPVEIKILGPADAGLYWKHRLRALLEEPEAFGSSYEESLMVPPDVVANRLECSDDAFALGAMNSGLVGSLRFVRHEGIKRRHKGDILSVYVEPEHRGRGIARGLLRELISRVSAILGVEYLNLSVVSTNKSAISLYKSIGFSTYGVEPAVIKIGDRSFDEDLMILKLDNKTW